MLTINASTLRATPSESSAPATTGGPGSSATTDPAGFASLLRQNRIAPAAAAPAPIPQAGGDAQPPTHGPDAAPTRDGANQAEAPQESDPSQVTRALLKTKLRAAEGAVPAPRAAKTTTDATPDATPDAIDGAKTLPGSEATAGKHGEAAARSDAPGSVNLDPNVMQWLAGLQRMAAAGEVAGKAAPDTSAQPATEEPAGLSTGQRAADLRAATDSKGKGASGTEQLADAANAGQFAGALAEQRLIDKPAAPQTGSPRALKETAAANAGAFAPTPPASIGAAAPVAVAIATPLNAPDFAQQLGLRLSVLARDGVQRAELHLNPADMGPVSVQIVMDGTRAHVDFGADMAATRQAIEAGLPELASALRDAGFTLAGGGVSQHSGGRSGGGDSASTHGGGRQRIVADDELKRVGTAAHRIVNQGGIDLFA